MAVIIHVWPPMRSPSSQHLADLRADPLSSPRTGPGHRNMNDVSPGERRLGMVFQNYALYPHLDSRSNVLSYFHFRKKTPELSAMAAAKYQRTSELMGVELEYLLDRRPTKLSGGEKQRVALGRCITRDPTLFLLDEPFSNLDQALRERRKAGASMLNATILSVQVWGHEIHAQRSIDESAPAGARVWLTLRRYHVFDKASGRRARTVDRRG